MNTAHWHLLLNHVPIIGILIGLLTGIASFIFKDISMRKTALGIFVFAAAMAIPVYLTGEGAEETVENLPGVNDQVLDKHEDLASVFIWMISALGVVALSAIIFEFYNSKLAMVIFNLTFILAVVAIISAQQLGISGGEIRHTEIRSSSPQTDGAMNDDDGGQPPK